MRELTALAQVWLRRFKPAPGSEVSLICFPHAGGAATFYRPLASLLAPAIDVLAVQYPGRQDRHSETPLKTVDALADAIAAVLAQSSQQHPILFLGHSMGAIVAFEVARRLEPRPGVDLLGLVASGRRAPSAWRAESVHLQSDAILVDEMQRLSGTDLRLLADEEMLRLILPAVRSDYMAIETYRCQPGARLACPLSVLLGDDDPQVTAEEAHQWSQHTSSTVTVRYFRGGHFYLNEQMPEVAAAVRSAIGMFREQAGLRQVPG